MAAASRALVASHVAFLKRDWRETITCAEKAVKLLDVAGHHATGDVAEALLLIVGAYEQLAEYPATLAAGERAVEAARAVGASGRANAKQSEILLGRCEIALGRCYQGYAGRTTEAIALLEHALVCFQEHSNEHTVMALIELACPYHFSGQSERGLRSLERAEVMCGSLPRGTKDRPLLQIKISTQMAVILASTGNFAGAIVKYRDALSMTDLVAGKNSALSAVTWSNLGAAQVELHHFSDAAESYSRAISLAERHGLQAGFFTFFLRGVGYVNEAQGNLRKAADFYERCLAIRRKILPPDHPDIASVMADLGRVNTALGDHAAADAVLSESISITRRSQVACAGPACVRKMREDGAPLDQCAGCLRTFYCSVGCQTTDWKAGHRKECKALQKLNAAGAGGATDAASSGGDGGSTAGGGHGGKS